MYGKTMHRLLHIGPGTCGVVSKLLKEGGSEAWGIQPFKMKEPVHKTCHNLLHKGFIRIADANRPLPYRSRSFSFVLVTDTLDVMKVRELNTTLNELSRLSAHSLVVIVSEALEPCCFLILQTNAIVYLFVLRIVVREAWMKWKWFVGNACQHCVQYLTLGLIVVLKMVWANSEGQLFGTLSLQASIVICRQSKWLQNLGRS